MIHGFHTTIHVYICFSSITWRVKILELNQFFSFICHFTFEWNITWIYTNKTVKSFCKNYYEYSKSRSSNTRLFHTVLFDFQDIVTLSRHINTRVPMKKSGESLVLHYSHPRSWHPIHRKPDTSRSTYHEKFNEYITANFEKTTSKFWQ